MTEEDYVTDAVCPYCGRRIYYNWGIFVAWSPGHCLTRWWKTCDRAPLPMVPS